MLRKVLGREDCESILAMVRMGKMRVVKEHSQSGPIYFALSAAGTPVGIIGEKYKYMFERELSKRGSGDGLFQGFSQTTPPPFAQERATRRRG